MNMKHAVAVTTSQPLSARPFNEPICFITGNDGKYREIQEILNEIKIERTKIDLMEVQSLNAQEIIEAKLDEAQKLFPGKSFLVEDTSLYLDALTSESGALPGPLIKWFLQSVGNCGLVTLTQLYANSGATARSIIGYVNAQGDKYFFEGSIRGILVEPRPHTMHFGWDAVFQPEGSPKTFAQMDVHEKNTCSMRAQAARKLLEHFMKNQS